MVESVSVPGVFQSPAKINLFLNVVGQRSDGYHDLETVFQFLDFADELEFETTRADTLSRIDEHVFELPQDDLIIKAASLLKTETGHSGGARITLKKRIPPGSGMGGGSSNAATTLMALNQIWELGLEKEHLIEIARRLGADVPVFIFAKSCWATAKGDAFSAFDPPELWFVLLVPDVCVSTRDIFSHPDLKRDNPPISQDDFRRGYHPNMLEPVTRMLYPEVDEAFELLHQYGSPRMNGSGSSIFIQCETRDHAIGISRQLPDHYHKIVSRSLNEIKRY